jgi:hypothetical protein
MNNKKRILILVMSCSDSFFENQVNKIKETWAFKILNKTYDNISFMYYRGNLDEETHYDNINNELVLKVDDDLYYTFKKTIYALKWINEHNIQYDYIFRTNTSTYINVELLNAFVQTLDDDNIVYSSELYSLIESNTPLPMNIYGRGNGLLISKKMINVLIENSLNLRYLELTDDVGIGNVLNSYWINKGENYINYIRSYCHGWFKAVEHVIYEGEKPEHEICSFDNANTDFNFLKKFITIQTKMYYNRELEDKNYDELHEIIYNNTDDNIDETLKFNINYSNNPNIFIGSILGYIPLDKWLMLPKDALFKLQANYKADNDIYKNKFKNRKYIEI